MGTHSESKNGTRILGAQLTSNFGAKTEPRFNKILEPCFQNENEPQKWFARTRRGGFRETIIGDQKRTLNVMRANPPRRVLAFRFSRSLRLAKRPRGNGPPGAQRTRAPRRAVVIPRTAAAVSTSPRGSQAKCSRQLRLALSEHKIGRECNTARAQRTMCACRGICIDAHM